MKADQIDAAMELLRAAVRAWQTPAVTVVSQREGSPFKVLVSCILSLRTQDRTTAAASERLFSLADTPAAMVALSVEEIEKAIYPVGFYRNKAVTIHDVSQTLLTQYAGAVPDTLEALLLLKGVGRKTANLVLTLGFAKPGICVDTHVHRISNRWGYVKTKTPDETEFALRKKLPRRYWLVINDLLVAFGQNHCSPISPKCSCCVLAHLCRRVGVGTCR